MLFFVVWKKFLTCKSERVDFLKVLDIESMQSPETCERELRPLRMIPDNYEKIVLSMDRNYIKSYEGIRSLYLIDWLLNA